jgi:hypothetical protein
VVVTLSVLTPLQPLHSLMVQSGCCGCCHTVYYADSVSLYARVHGAVVLLSFNLIVCLKNLRQSCVNSDAVTSARTMLQQMSEDCVVCDSTAS